MKMNRENGLIILCDFDGTIANFDMAEMALEKFARGEWRVYDKQLERREITIEECVNRQFSTVSASEEEIIAAIDQEASFRPNFDLLLSTCRRAKIPVVIVSAGLDFVIKHFMKKNVWESARLHTAKTKLTGHSIEFNFPRPKNIEAADFKDDLVIESKKEGRVVAYMGDGLSDFNAIGKADIPFAVEGKKLIKHCMVSGIPCRSFRDFKEVLQALIDLGLMPT
jgi:2-hydroxy-3-keto-5-methylthiopentenyl-1-phosphate phosphatase